MASALHPNHALRIAFLETVAEDASTFCNSRILFSAEGNGLTNMLLLPPVNRDSSLQAKRDIRLQSIWKHGEAPWHQSRADPRGK